MAAIGKDLKHLFLAHRRELQAYLADKLGDSETAADLTQEAFLRFAEQPQPATVLNHRAYLYRITRNLAIDHVRQAARQQTQVLPTADLADLPDGQPDIEDAAAARQRLEQVRLALAELPARTRQAFLLNRIDGLSYLLVAQRLGISESSVQKHLARALLHVMRRLEQR